MRSIFDIYDKSGVIARECKVRSDVTEKGTQLGLDTVCGGPPQWAPTTQHQSPPRGLVIALLTPTSAP